MSHSHNFLHPPRPVLRLFTFYYTVTCGNVFLLNILSKTFKQEAKYTLFVYVLPSLWGQFSKSWLLRHRKSVLWFDFWL